MAEVPTVLFYNPATKQTIRYNASDVVANPMKFMGLEMVAQQGEGAAVSLPAEKFATAEDYIKPEWHETPITAKADDAPMASTKKRGRPAKGV